MGLWSGMVRIYWVMIRTQSILYMDGCPWCYVTSVSSVTAKEGSGSTPHPNYALSRGKWTRDEVLCVFLHFCLSVDSVSYMYRKDTPWNDPPILATSTVRRHAHTHTHTHTHTRTHTHTHTHTGHLFITNLLNCGLIDLLTAKLLTVNPPPTSNRCNSPTASMA